MKITLVVISFLFFLASLFLYLNKTNPELITKAINLIGQPNHFKWGIGINPYPTAQHTSEISQKVLAKAKELGVDYVRMEVPGWANDPFSIIDPSVEQAKKLKLKFVLVLQPKEEILRSDDPYQDGSNLAFQFASHYKGKIKYYQLGNEIGTIALKPSWSGARVEAYDLIKFQKVAAWLKGASEGIKKGDPKAGRIITGHWLQTGFFELLTKENINLEVIGWDWFNEEKNITQLEDENKPFNLLTKLESFNKEVWLMEAGKSSGPTFTDEEKQAEYLKNFAIQIYNSPVFSGFFVHVFYDQAHLIGTTGAYDGILKIKTISPGLWQLGEPKKAFWIYQEAIRQLKGRKGNVR